MPFKIHPWILCLLLPLAIVAGQPAQADAPVRTEVVPVECGGPEITNHYGPYDYTNPTHVRDRLYIVESAHFTNAVESLVRGETGAFPGGDLDYTLRAFPNHHRALYAMGRYQLMNPGKRVPPGANWTADCYFRRAIGFNPQDGVARMIYAMFLAKSSRTDEALSQYQVALELAPNSAELHNNVALLYIDLGDFDSAREHASRAEELGFPLAGARGKLERMGEWPAPSAARAESED